MPAERQIEILKGLAEKMYNANYWKFMCSTLSLDFQLADEEVEEILATLWETRVKEKIKKEGRIEKNGRPFVWYDLKTIKEHKEVRIQNIDNAIKKLQESLEITK